MATSAPSGEAIGGRGDINSLLLPTFPRILQTKKPGLQQKRSPHRSTTASVTPFENETEHLIALGALLSLGKSWGSSPGVREKGYTGEQLSRWT